MASVSKTIPDLETEAIAAKYGVTRQTVVRWITNGVDGVRLKGRMIGRSWRTTQADLELFFRSLTEAALSK